MANGDAASQAGMDVVPGTADRRNGYDEINKTRDYLANHQTSGGHPADKVITSGQLPVAKGGTGAATASDARAALGVGDSGTHPERYYVRNDSVVSNQLRMRFELGRIVMKVDATDMGQIAYLSDITNPDLSAYRRLDNGDFGNTPISTPWGRGNTASSNWVTAALDGSGRLMVSPSALRFKDNIEDFELTDEQAAAFLAMRGVTFTLKGDESGETHIGWIAEEVQAAGFDKLVPTITDPDAEDYGLPITVEYGLSAVVLHQLIKRQAAQIAEQAAELAALTARIETLEGK